MPRARTLLRPLAALALLLLATLLLYGGSLKLWWGFDDPAILLHAHRYSPWEYFFIPSAWQALIPYSLQPWLSLSYDLDLALFGFRPALFFAHHLLALALCAWCLQRVLAQWVSEAWALAGGLLLLAGTPMATAAQQLMVRHYVEGLAFYLLGLWLLLRRLRGGGPMNTGLSGLAFAIAASAKEVFLPLGLLPFVLPMGTLRQRLRAGWPWLLVMALYVPWRYHMLGELVGGYVPQGGTVGLGVADVLNAFAGAPALLWAWPLVAGLGMALLLVAAWRPVAARWRATLLWALPLPVLLFAPLLPLVRFPGIGPGSERYFMAPWTVLAALAAVVLGLAWQRQRQPGVRVLLLAGYAALLLPAWQLSRQAAAQLVPVQAAHKAVGLALVHAQPRDVVQGTPGVSTWFIQGLLELRAPMGQAGPAPRLAADESDLAGADLAGARVLRYDPASAAMQDVTAQQAQQQQIWRQKLRGDVTLRVNTGYDGRLNAIRWQLSSSVPGSFAFLSAGSALPLPSQGAIRRDTAPIGCFRIRLQTADGGLAYSPLLQWPAVAPGADAKVAWQGAGDSFSGPPPACR